MTTETKNYGNVNNTHILTMFGDEMTYNELKDLPLDLTTELKVSFNRSVIPTTIKVWFDDEIVIDWKPMVGHHDLFYHLQALDEENEGDGETDEEEEEEEDGDDDEEWSLTENQRCWGNLIDEEFPNTTPEQKKCLLSIAREVDFIDIKPYSHNIVGMELGFLDKAGFDKQKIKEVVKLFGLEDKGWKYLLVDSDL